MSQVWAWTSRPRYMLPFSALAFPLAWQEMGGDIRRALVHRFPYGILYVPQQNQILIVAVMHLHRQPGYWQGRTA